MLCTRSKYEKCNSEFNIINTQSASKLFKVNLPEQNNPRTSDIK